MQIPTQCEVVVVGGGPAGSTVATLLAQNGIDVVLFDKQKHPRYNVGESVIPDFWRYTDLTGATPKIEAEGFIAKAGGVVNWQGESRGHDFASFGFERPALHVERDRFDYILLNHAREEGVSVFENVAVTSAQLETTDPVYVSYRDVVTSESGKIACRYVLDASGQNAVIGRQLGVRVVDKAFRYLAIWGYFDDGRYFDKQGQSHPLSEIHTVPPTTYVSSLSELGDDGWSWYIPLRQKISVGFVFPLSMMRSLKQEGESWETYFERKCRTVPVIRDLIASGKLCANSVRVTRDYSYRSTKVAGPGYFLLGDAAGFVDPISSIGVAFSLYMAFIAAIATEQAIKKPEKAAAYQAIYTRQLEGRLEVARSLALPRYQMESQVGELAKEAIQLDQPNVQEMMQVVTSLTNRAQNFKEILTDIGAEDRQPHQLWEIDSLEV